MPNKDGTGPRGKGPRNGRGKGLGNRGQQPSGPKTGGRRGNC